jgi:Ser/Thr protein kinase RdoA (MazF antagonist)
MRAPPLTVAEAERLLFAAFPADGWAALVDRSQREQPDQPDQPDQGQRSAGPFRPSALLPLGRGWDADVFLVLEQGAEDRSERADPAAEDAPPSPRFTVRFSRTAAAREAMTHERTALAVIARSVSFPVPVPLASAVLPATAAWPEPRLLLVQTYLPGHTVVDRRRLGWVDLSTEAHHRLARGLGQALRSLHALPSTDADGAREGEGALPLGIDLPIDPLGRLDVRRRRDPARAQLAALVAAGRFADEEGSLLDEIVATPPAELPPGHAGGPDAVVLHADLHGGNLLVDAAGAGELTGVIDWVDLSRGAAAIDLAAMFEALPAAAWPTFEAAYGPISALSIAWARWRAVTHLLVCLPAPSPETGAQRDSTGWFETIVEEQLRVIANASASWNAYARAHAHGSAGGALGSASEPG